MTTRSASGTVHWIGAGLSTGSGLRAVSEAAERTTVWARDPDRARTRLAAVDLHNDVRPLDDLERAIRPGDVVVSMVPAAEHARWLRLCIQAGAHFACSSYASPELTGLATGASQTTVLTEAGLDPGLDHLLAHVLVADARDKVGDGPAQAWFHSDCGGLPAQPNDFRYRFSWAPRGVLHALREPARYIEDGEVRQASEPWEHTRRRSLVDGGETFEVYPNRDSLPFQQRYGFSRGWHLQAFCRGTIRLDGWRAAWGPVFEVLRTGDDERIDALAVELAARYPTGPTDRDRVVLSVTLRVDDWAGGHMLDIYGDERESAMARCVSLPLAVGVEDILSGRTPAGLTRAAEDAVIARRWLARLAELGITTTENGT
ncbi:MAG TPA: saccharopine dehydrogenase C-terminal domain-containing protein [Candidatus Limnocylindrales bacterium]|nr:saccharopine dehydrogenase C-terminal domain-containing protein [Candidatus Limnocylindrales bacterium]